MVSGEKRNIEGDDVMEKVTGILLDIEGTTTSISFVKDTLFPYVKDNLESYVEAHWNDDEFKGDVSALKEQAKKDEEDKVEGLTPIEDGEKEKETLINNVLWQMSQDRKTTALKQLQGHIWREGYKSGILKGHDVVPALKKWKDESKKVYIFSSGSVDAQKLLFSYSEEGDLSEYISGYFDTTTGPKLESNSYVSIVKAMGCEKDEVLFLTDIIKEAEAARSAGLQTVLVVREGNAPLTDDDKKQHFTVTSFGELTYENLPKRKKLSDENEAEERVPEQQQQKAEKEGEEFDAQVNGAEKMDVDKTEEDSKTDGGDDVEIDVVSSSEEKKEEQEAEAVNGSGEQDEAEAEASEPQVDAIEPTKEVLEASDPLEITSEKEKEEETPAADDSAATTITEEAPATESTEKPEESKDAQGEEEASNESDKAEEAKNGTSEDSQSSSDGGKVVNGDGFDENSGDTIDSSGNLALKKVAVPAEDKPEPTVEVKA